MIEAEAINHEYLPVLGLDSFATAATTMLLGKGGFLANVHAVMGIVN
jgi:hypothetical protein